MHFVTDFTKMSKYLFLENEELANICSNGHFFFQIYDKQIPIEIREQSIYIAKQ